MADRGTPPRYGSYRGNEMPKTSTAASAFKEAALKIVTFNAEPIVNKAQKLKLEEELEKIKWDVLGVSDVGRKGEEYMTLKSGNQFYFKGNEDNTHAVVEFAFKKSMEKDNKNKRNIRKMQVYAPTSSHEDEEKGEIYEDVIKNLAQNKVGKKDKAHEKEIKYENTEIQSSDRQTTTTEKRRLDRNRGSARNN
ncbi:hypothetical protein ILUMI_01576 [Ignelater luminosus]|uniref:Uncharacterized protein n=1 Tax=Ignelater luminosus TaxID=2038154 RepID=A0A8K0GLL3_IGNLU|nr:hypothetical protein ILUMI_01576 [Ignelater luminosus]